MGIVSPHFSKPISKLLNQMVFGLQSAKDIKLSHAAQALDEPIELKKTGERLPRDLQTEGINGNRHVIFNGRAREELDVALGCTMKYAEAIVKETRKVEKV